MSENLELKRSPMHNFHVRHEARFVPFAGWEMPIQYTSIMEEHVAVRRKAGLFDVSHMGEALVHGKDSEAFLNSLMTNNIMKLEEGKGIYTLICYEGGGVVDDLLVYRYGPSSFLLCLNASNTERDMEWLKGHKGEYDCHIEDVSSQYGQLALQGPMAVEILGRLVDNISSLGRFCFTENKISGIETIISRTGYTGEDGYELYCPAEESEFFVETLYDVGQEFGLMLAGLGARDSLRLEAGYPLYGHEISEQITPLEAGMGFAVKLKKEADFVGKDALKKQKAEGLEQKIVYFKLEGRRIARQGAKVYEGDKEVGEVMSGTMSPILEKPIGSALVRLPYEGELTVDIRGNRIPLLIVVPPFL